MWESSADAANLCSPFSIHRRLCRRFQIPARHPDKHHAERPPRSVPPSNRSAPSRPAADRARCCPQYRRFPSSTLAKIGCERSQSTICGPTALAGHPLRLSRGSARRFRFILGREFIAAAPCRPWRQPADHQRVRPRHRRRRTLVINNEAVRARRRRHACTESLVSISGVLNSIFASFPARSVASTTSNATFPGVTTSTRPGLASLSAA